MPSRRLEMFGSKSLLGVAQPAVANSAHDNTNALARRRPWRTGVLPRGSYLRQRLPHNPDRDLTRRGNDPAENQQQEFGLAPYLPHYLAAIELSVCLRRVHRFKKAPQTLELDDLAASWLRSKFARGDGGCDAPVTGRRQSAPAWVACRFS